MNRISPNTKTILLVSTTSWLMAAVLINLIGNIIPVMFQFQRYFFACMLFGFGLGFFKSNGAGEAQVDTRQMETVWAKWLAVICGALLIFVCLGASADLANAAAIAVLDESRDIFDYSLVKHSVITDIFTVFLTTLLLLSIIQLFAAPGKRLRQLITDHPCKFNLPALALGAVIAWTAYTVLDALTVPPEYTLAACIAVFWRCSSGKKLCAILALFSAVSGIYVCSNLVPKERKLSSNLKAYLTSHYLVSGSRLSMAAVNQDDRNLAIAVYKDGVLYQILPGQSFTADSMGLIGKAFGLPDFPFDYHQLPYLVIPDMKGKTGAILGSSFGCESAVARAHLGSIVATDSYDWPIHVPAPTNSEELDDPRHSLRNSSNKYDLILIAEHAASSRPSPFTPLNHNDYLFTTQTLDNAFSRLQPDGRLIIACQANNEVVRLRLAASLLSVAHKIEASLTTPFANYLIVSKTDSNFGPASTNVQDLRKTLGGKIVNHEQWLTSVAQGVMPYTNDRPFMIGQGPFMPLSEAFFITMTMLSQLIAVRVTMQQSMLENITKKRCRIVLYGAIFMLLMCKALMVIPLLLSLTSAVILWSVVCGWAVFFAACLPALIERRLPPRFAWSAFALAIVFDSCFPYSYFAAQSSGWTGAIAVPWVAPFCIALIAAGEINEPGADEKNIGLFLIGFSLGLLFSISALFNGITSLDGMAALLAIICGLLTWLPSKNQQGIIEAT